MFEDDVTVPAGWYPDPMGLPQLRWWNNHAWTELTSEARPPLVMQTPTKLAYADDELPTRRQQREQRERDEQYVRLATDEDEARDNAAAHAPLTVTLKEIEPPAKEAAPVEEPAGESITPAASTASTTTSTASDVFEASDLDDDDDSIDAGDRVTVPEFAPVPAPTSPSFVDPIDYSAAEDVPLGAPATGVAEESEAFSTLFQPRSAATAVSSPAAQDMRPVEVEVVEPPVPTSAAPLPRLPIYTAPVWIIALVPLLLLVVSLLMLLGFGSSLGPLVTPIVFAAAYVFVVLLAIADSVALKRAGYEHRASWAWALLTAPIYLIARSMSLAKVGPLGFAPVLVFAALGILQLGSVLVVPGLIISALPQTFRMQAEQSIASDASIIGAKLTVDCKDALPVLIGQTFSCAATSASGESYDVTVSLERTNGWIDWHVDDWGIYSLSR